MAINEPRIAVNNYCSHEWARMYTNLARRCARAACRMGHTREAMYAFVYFVYFVWDVITRGYLLRAIYFFSHEIHKIHEMARRCALAACRMKTTEGCTKTITKTKTNKSVVIRRIRVIRVPLKRGTRNEKRGTVNDDDDETNKSVVIR